MLVSAQVFKQMFIIAYDVVVVVVVDSHANHSNSLFKLFVRYARWFF